MYVVIMGNCANLITVTTLACASLGAELKVSKLVGVGVFALGVVTVTECVFLLDRGGVEGGGS